ncbi:invasion associated locus B family protein [uncultured Pseudoteredinibacter sp.]|uniref:invasion associated locus B family protein n=1 Tax=uncultured Pseudoteredinibacter sp. TaxID=1641701 RepID=UPI00260A27AE|nr:invasion associated locus B family protein [uncultured Pseudoteredinibacter sp.]
MDKRRSQSKDFNLRRGFALITLLFAASASLHSSAQAELNGNVAKTTTLSKPNNLPDEAASSPATNPSAQRETDRTVFKDWVLNCGDGDCIVHQYILDEKKRVISSVSLHQKADSILITFTVPLMTRIDHGVDLSIIRYDGKEIYKKNYGYSYCTQIGCMLTYTLGDELIKPMQAGRKLKLAFAALDGRVVNSIHSLFGFSKALEHFKELPAIAKTKLKR